MATTWAWGHTEVRMPHFLNFKNFQIVSGPSQSISQSWINGKESFSQSYTYIIKPLKKGEFLIPAASIKLNEKRIKSKPIKIIVLDPVEIPKDPNDPNYIAQQNIHLVAEISKSNPYVGEGIYVEYRLYVSQNISVRDFSYTESPQYNGFWNQDIKIRGLTTKNGTYNGEQYRYVVLQKALLIPTKSGKLTIDPIKMDIVIGVPTGRGDFFGNPIVRNITRSFASAKKYVRSKELPLINKPESFNGAVGDFNFIVTSSKDILKSNETATISMKVTGKGNLKLFELPEIKTPSELEVFTPEQKEKIKISSRGIRGSITKNYTVVPQYKGKYKIPSTEFSYFDLTEKKYVTLKSDDLFVDVLEGKELVTDSDTSINSKKDIKVTGIPSQQRDGEGAVFLLDSGEVSTTAPMINIFMEKMKKDGFRKMLNNQFIKYTNSCVEDFLNGDLSSLFLNTKKLSKVVFDNFKPMIPNKYHSLWKKGIDNDSYFLKLCGSGGGGYILGFTKNIEKAKKELTGHKIEVVYNF